jgi:diguanylate cyclase (GGDEF)-like protein
MPIDTPTVVLVTIATCASLGLASIGLSLLQAGTRGVRHWGAGMLGLGIGYSLLYLSPSLSTPWILHAGWVFLIGSVLLMYRALRRICGVEDPQFGFAFAVLAGAAAGWLFFEFVVPSDVHMIDVTSVAVSVVTGRGAFDLWRHARGNSQHKAPPLVVAALLLVIATTPATEIVMRGNAPVPLMEFGPPVVVFARVLMISLLSISVLWMEISRLYEAMEVQATHDELTGLANRRAIVAQLQRELQRAGREGTACSIALIDIDHFKRVNDTWGHPAGDEVLRWISRVICANVRPYDTLGRYGGEEFLLVMPGTTRETALSVTDRARAAVAARPCVVGDAQIELTFSAGVTTGAGDADFDALLIAADLALYSAKQGGRNRIAAGDAAPQPAATPQPA